MQQKNGLLSEHTRTSNPLPVAVHPMMSGFSPSRISYSLEGNACVRARGGGAGALAGSLARSIWRAGGTNAPVVLWSSANSLLARNPSKDASTEWKKKEVRPTESLLLLTKTTSILRARRPTCGAPLLPKRGYLDTAVVEEEEEEAGEGAGAGAGGDGGALRLATIWLSREAAFLTTLWTTPIFSLFRSPRFLRSWAAASTRHRGAG